LVVTCGRAEKTQQTISRLFTRSIEVYR